MHFFSTNCSVVAVRWCTFAAEIDQGVNYRSNKYTFNTNMESNHDLNSINGIIFILTY